MKYLSALFFLTFNLSNAAGAAEVGRDFLSESGYSCDVFSGAVLSGNGNPINYPKDGLKFKLGLSQFGSAYEIQVDGVLVHIEMGKNGYSQIRLSSAQGLVGTEFAVANSEI